MSKLTAGTIGFLIAAVIVIAIVTAPTPDNCTPRLIAKYTNDMISHQECEAMPRCIIEPSDIRYFHNAQINFRTCVMIISGEEQRKLEESKDE